MIDLIDIESNPFSYTATLLLVCSCFGLHGDEAVALGIVERAAKWMYRFLFNTKLSIASVSNTPHKVQLSRAFRFPAAQTSY